MGKNGGGAGGVFLKGPVPLFLMIRNTRYIEQRQNVDYNKVGQAL